jgi:anti-sigma regulatory factor (Ser/Thr protein kinase)
MRIVLSSDPRLLNILRAVVRYCAQETGFTTEEADCMAMAIDEAASNVIRHAYGNRRDERLALEIASFPDRIEFVLEDSGPKVQAGILQPRSLEEVRPGGLGTYFIKCFMDETSFDEHFPGGNRLKLVKYLTRKAALQDESPSPERP